MGVTPSTDGGASMEELPNPAGFSRIGGGAKTLADGGGGAAAALRNVGINVRRGGGELTTFLG